MYQDERVRHAAAEGQGSVSEQLARNKAELERMRTEEQRLLAMKIQSRADSEETSQYEIGLNTLRQQ